MGALSLCHAMSSGVAFMMRTGPPDDGGLMKIGRAMQGSRRSLKINNQMIMRVLGVLWRGEGGNWRSAQVFVGARR